MRITLGIEIFRTRNLADMRQQLERKAITCVLLGQRNEHLPAPIALKNELLRNAYHLAGIAPITSSLLQMDGSIGDVFRDCAMDGLPAIISDSPQPRWGEDDVTLLGHVSEIEKLEASAWEGGILI